MSKWFGDVVAVSERQLRARLRGHRAARTERRRQVHGAPAAVRADRRRPGRRCASSGRDPRVDIGVLAPHRPRAPAGDRVRHARRAYEFVQHGRPCSTASPRPDRGGPPGPRARRARPRRPPPAWHATPRACASGSRWRRRSSTSPRVIVLDEPLTGLDPRQRRHMIDLFHALGDLGRCVIVSSHVLDEVERFGSERPRHRAGPAGRRGRLPGHPRPDGRPPPPAPPPHRPTPASSPADLLADGLDRGPRAGGRPDGGRGDRPRSHAFRRTVAVVARDVGARLVEVVPARRRPRLGLPLPGGPAVSTDRGHRAGRRPARPRGTSPARTWLAALPPVPPDRLSRRAR